MRKNLFVLAIFLLASGLVLSICTTHGIAAEKPQYGGKAVIACGKGPRAFGYPPKLRGYDNELSCSALESLVESTVKDVIEPKLAESWDVSPDGKTMTFKLRKGVKFHDGTDFNAQAVKWNIDKIKGKKKTFLTTLASMDVIDDHTIRLNFSEFDAVAFYDLAGQGKIVSPSAIEKNGEKWAETHPVGTGPFKLKEFDRKSHVLYERNPNYWKKGLPYLDEIEFRHIKDSMTQVSALKTGEVDVIYDILPLHADMLAKQGYNVSKMDQLHVGLYGDSNHPDSPWSKKKVREAAEYAINRESLVKNLSNGYYTVLYQYVSSRHPYFNPDIKPRMYDPEKAKKLLAEAGYPNGFSTTIFHYAPHWPESWAAIQADLAKVGIKAKLDTVDRAKYYEIKLGKDALKDGLTHMQINASDIVWAFKYCNTSDCGQYLQYARPDGFDELVGKIRSEPDAGKRKQMIFQATKMLYDNAAFIPVNIQAKLAAITEKLHGVNLTTYSYSTAEFWLNAWKGK